MARPGQIPSVWGPRWSRWLGWFLAKVFWHTEVFGVLPAHGAVLFAANHAGAADGPVVHGVVGRPNHLLVKAELFHSRVAFLLWTSGQIYTDRLAGRGALTAAVGVLNRGGVVGVFPEGYRGQGRANEVKGGIGWLAVHSGAPVVPVAVLGTRPTGKPISHVPRFRARLVVDIGEPFHPQIPAGLPGRRAVLLAAEQIRDRMAAHIDAAAERHGIALPQDGPTDVGQAS